VDSEDPMLDIEKPWDHLSKRDKWIKPAKATDGNVFLMTTCMETLYAADPQALTVHFGPKFNAQQLPSQHNLESRHRHEVQESVARATKDCPNQYAKGKHSYEILGKLNPDVLAEKLPSFKRTRRILDSVLIDKGKTAGSK